MFYRRLQTEVSIPFLAEPTRTPRITLAIIESDHIVNMNDPLT